MVVIIGILVAVQMLGVVIVLIASARAPSGFEDEDGFHKVEREFPLPVEETSLSETDATIAKSHGDRAESPRAPQSTAGSP